MTRSEVLRLAEATEKHLDKAYAFMKRITGSNHPAAPSIYDVFEDNSLMVTWDIKSMIEDALDDALEAEK